MTPRQPAVGSDPPRSGTFHLVNAGAEEARVYVAGPRHKRQSTVLVLHAWWGLNDDVVAK